MNFYFHSNPWFDSIKFRENSNVPKPAASRILRKLSESNILDLIRKGSGRRPSLYVFPELLKIIK